MTTAAADLRPAPALAAEGTSPEASVLAIQTEPETQSVLAQGLGCLGLSVDTASDAEAGISAALSGRYELILLDLILPGADGFRALAQIRDARPQLPVIVLTALGGLEHRVRALEAGAIDYVVKPFSLRELAARIHAQVRQAGSYRSTRLSGAGIDVDLLTRTVSRHGVPVHLTTMEFRLLVHLMQRPGTTHTRRDILRDVWGQELEPGKNVVDVYVGYLRRKLSAGDPDSVSLIQTVRSRGYRFVDNRGPDLQGSGGASGG